MKPFAVRSYSSKHRVRNYFPLLIKPRGVGSSITFAVPDKTSQQDTLPTVIDGVASYSYAGSTWSLQLDTADLIPKDIIGKIILHEVGGGTNDLLLNKCIIEAFPKDDYLNYDYSLNNDPKFEYDLRSNIWITQNLGNNVGDLVLQNMNVRGGLNPFTSVMQTPTDYSTTTNDKVPFDGDDDYGSLKGKPVESLILLAPINTKFRRAVFTFTSIQCVVVRSIIITMTEYTRKGFG